MHESVETKVGDCGKYMGNVSLVRRIWRATYIRGKNFLKEYLYEQQWKEKRRVYGIKNQNKIFYIVRRRELYVGLFSHFIVYVYNVKKALDNGYIPIIDMQNNENLYLKKEQIGRVNAWEYYFKQPCGYNLKDIKNSRNVIWGSGFVNEMFPYMDIDYLLKKKGDFEKYQEVTRKYFKLSDDAQNEVDQFFDKHLSGYRVLGVLCRGTDYVANKPSGHAVQPTVEQLFAKIDEVIEKYDCNKIFLGTEDYEMYQSFRTNYGEKVITNRKDFIKYSGETSIGWIMQQQKSDVYREGMDYLVTMSILAKCNYFVAGHTSGTVGVLLMTEGVEYSYIFDLGLYD